MVLPSDDSTVVCRTDQQGYMIAAIFPGQQAENQLSFLEFRELGLHCQ
jgi:hypothetical protein